MKLKLKKCITCKEPKINAENYIRLKHGRYSKVCNDCRKVRQEYLNRVKTKPLIIEKRPTVARLPINEDLQGLTPKEVLAIAKKQEAKKKFNKVPIFKGYRLCEVK